MTELYVLEAVAAEDLRSIVRYTRKTWSADQARAYAGKLRTGIVFKVSELFIPPPTHSPYLFWHFIMSLRPEEPRLQFRFMIGLAMPTVLTLRNIRVSIYTNDHPPSHVHALKGNEAEARLKLNCPEGPVELWDYEGFKLVELNEIGALIADNLQAVCAKWSEIHG